MNTRTRAGSIIDLRKQIQFINDDLKPLARLSIYNDLVQEKYALEVRIDSIEEILKKPDAAECVDVGAYIQEAYQALSVLKVKLDAAVKVEKEKQAAVWSVGNVASSAYTSVTGLFARAPAVPPVGALLTPNSNRRDYRSLSS